MNLEHTALVSVLIACILGFSCIWPATALSNDDVPRTTDEIHKAAQQTLRSETLAYLSAKYSGTGSSPISIDQLSDAVGYYPEYPRQIIDSKGTTITIFKPLTRIVAYNFHPIGALHADDLVVGVANSALRDGCVVPAVYEKVNIGGGGPYEPDFEKVLSCKPDALLTYTELGPGPDFFENRMPEGVPVIRLDCIRPWSLVDEMDKLGYILNRTDRSDAYREWHSRWMDEIDTRLSLISEEKKVRVFVDIWSLSFTDRNNERRTAGGGQWYSYGIYATDGGGINVAEGLGSQQSTVDIEWLIQQNPDVILGVSYTGSYDSDDIRELSTQYDELLSHPALQEIPAIKNKRVYTISYRYTNGLTYPAARVRVAKWFYPELFADIDPSSIHQEYLMTFLGSDFDVTEHGVFSYPD